MEVVGVAVGAALAVPGLIDVLIRGGAVIVEKVDTYQKVDETLDGYVHRLYYPFDFNALLCLTMLVTDNWAST